MPPPWISILLLPYNYNNIRSTIRKQNSIKKYNSDLLSSLLLKIVYKDIKLLIRVCKQPICTLICSTSEIILPVMDAKCQEFHPPMCSKIMLARSHNCILYLWFTAIETESI